MVTSEIYKRDVYDYDILKERIAQYPLPERDKSRLLVLDQKGRIEHRVFSDIIDYLRPGDVLVQNDTSVIPARIKAIKDVTGGKVDILLLKDLGNERWEAMIDKRLEPYQRLSAGNGAIRGQFISENGRKIVQFYGAGVKGVNRVIREIGLPPLPPYIKRNGSDPESGSEFDRERYQTVYAEKEGSLAAPTAGLHFTDRLLKKIKDMGVKIARVTLHIGPGTFNPVRVEDIRYHRMEEEFFQVPLETAKVINRAKKEGRRVVAVGTTSTRALESASNEKGEVAPGSGFTNLFIYPGYRFRVIDALITNFHQPSSTLILLVAGLAGLENVKEAYKEAMDKGYRFYSYGDAMMILRPQWREDV